MQFPLDSQSSLSAQRNHQGALLCTTAKPLGTLCQPSGGPKLVPRKRQQSS